MTKACSVALSTTAQGDWGRIALRTQAPAPIPA
jgi:hypothetical protein